MSETSAKPYLIRAIYERCAGNSFTPYIAVFIDNSTSMPREFVENDEIVLNMSFDTTSQLGMGDEWTTFHAHFSGVSRKVEVPVENVLAVYARENDQGMAFPVERSTPTTQATTERENNPPPKLTAVDSESVPAFVPAGVEADPKDEPAPPNVPRIGGKPAPKTVK